MDQKIELAESMVGYIDKIKSYVPKLADKYKNNMPVEASEDMLALTEGLDWMISAISILNDEIDFDKTRLLKILSKIQNSLESNEYLGLSDILNYEVIPTSEEIQEKFNEYISNNMN